MSRRDANCDRRVRDLPKVGRYNQAVVLDQIQLADGISRVEIAERTGLTPQTISGIVRRLIDEGMVREDGASRVLNGGKPRTTLRLNPDARAAIGVHFDPVKLTCTVIDLLGRPLAVRRRPVAPGTDPAAVVAAMAALVDEVLAESQVPLTGCWAWAWPRRGRWTRTAVWSWPRPSSRTGRGCRCSACSPRPPGCR